MAEIYFIMLFATALAIFQHRENIARLVKHEERKVSFSKSKKKNVD